MSKDYVDLNAIGHGIAGAAAVMGVDGIGQSIFGSKQPKNYNNNPKPLHRGSFQTPRDVQRKHGNLRGSNRPSQRNANVKPPSVSVLGAGSGSRIPVSTSKGLTMVKYDQSSGSLGAAVGRDDRMQDPVNELLSSMRNKKTLKQDFGLKLQSNPNRRCNATMWFRHKVNHNKSYKDFVPEVSKVFGRDEGDGKTCQAGYNNVYAAMGSMTAGFKNSHWSSMRRLNCARPAHNKVAHGDDAASEPPSVKAYRADCFSCADAHSYLRDVAAIQKVNFNAWYEFLRPRDLVTGSPGDPVAKPQHKSDAAPIVHPDVALGVPPNWAEASAGERYAWYTAYRQRLDDINNFNATLRGGGSHKHWPGLERGDPNLPEDTYVPDGSGLIANNADNLVYARIKAVMPYIGDIDQMYNHNSYKCGSIPSFWSEITLRDLECLSWDLNPLKIVNTIQTPTNESAEYFQSGYASVFAKKHLTQVVPRVTDSLRLWGGSGINRYGATTDYACWKVFASASNKAGDWDTQLVIPATEGTQWVAQQSDGTDGERHVQYGPMDVPRLAESVVLRNPHEPYGKNKQNNGYNGSKDDKSGVYSMPMGQNVSNSLCSYGGDYPVQSGLDRAGWNEEGAIIRGSKATDPKEDLGTLINGMATAWRSYGYAIPEMQNGMTTTKNRYQNTGAHDLHAVSGDDYDSVERDKYNIQLHGGYVSLRMENTRDTDACVEVHVVKLKDGDEPIVVDRPTKDYCMGQIMQHETHNNMSRGFNDPFIADRPAADKSDNALVDYRDLRFQQGYNHAKCDMGVEHSRTGAQRTIAKILKNPGKRAGVVEFGDEVVTEEEMVTDSSVGINGSGTNITPEDFVSNPDHQFLAGGFGAGATDYNHPVISNFKRLNFSDPMLGKADSDMHIRNQATDPPLLEPNQPDEPDAQTNTDTIVRHLGGGSSTRVFPMYGGTTGESTYVTVKKMFFKIGACQSRTVKIKLPKKSYNPSNNVVMGGQADQVNDMAYGIITSVHGDKYAAGHFNGENEMTAIEGHVYAAASVNVYGEYVETIGAAVLQKQDELAPYVNHGTKQYSKLANVSDGNIRPVVVYPQDSLIPVNNNQQWSGNPIGSDISSPQSNTRFSEKSGNVMPVPNVTATPSRPGV